jgi:hypothetical protein
MYHRPSMGAVVVGVGEKYCRLPNSACHEIDDQVPGSLSVDLETRYGVRELGR